MTQYFTGTERNRSAESEACYRKEWKEIMDCLYSYPCIGVWVPFNEAWGQFKTPEIAAWTKQYDPTRLVNPASGGNHYTCGDILDLHRYPEPEMYLYDAQRVTVLGEFGGLGLVVQDHLWTPDRNWGYREYKNSTEVTDAYVKAANVLLDMVPSSTISTISKRKSFQSKILTMSQTKDSFQKQQDGRRSSSEGRLSFVTRSSAI